MNFSKEHLKKVVKLGEEYLNASSTRQKEIEEELISLAPEKTKNDQQSYDIEIKTLHDQMKDKIDSLVTCSEKHDFDSYFKELAEIQHALNERARKLGVELDQINLTGFKKMLEKNFDKS